MCTGYHAADSAVVKEGDIVAVVRDGAVGLSAVLGAKPLGASRIIALSRHADRQEVAREFGATDIVADAALECIGTDQSIETAAGVTRAGGMIRAVGVPLYERFEYQSLFWKSVGIKGGVAPARQYIPELLDRVLAGDMNPGLVFNLTTDLDDVAEAYAAMDERRAIKSLLTVSRP